MSLRNVEASQSVRLTWDRSASPDVSGYRIGIGSLPGSYLTSVDVGNESSFTIPNLADGTTYYFAVTAYTAASIESDPSNELSYSTDPAPPNPIPTPSPTATPGPSPTPSPTPLPSPSPAPSPTPAPSGSAAVTVDVTQVTQGGIIRVTVTNGPGNPSDIVGALDTATGQVGDWLYLNGSKSQPASGLTSATVSFGANNAGRFQYVLSSGYALLASSPVVTVSATGPTPTPTPAPLPTATPAPTPLAGNFASVSTRANVGTGDNVLIGGLVISGTQPKRVLLRAIGPSLTTYGVAGALFDPVLAIHDAAGLLIAANDNWRTNQAAVEATGRAPQNENEAAIVTTLSPGAYTAVVSGANDRAGVALIELYDLEPENGRVASISTRGKIGTSDAVMIGGFTIGGSQSTRVIIRAIGPSLADYGVDGVLADPMLELYNSSGSRIFSNDNWQSDQQDQIVGTTLAPSDPREAAIIANLPPGSYTAVVRGEGNQTGVALVEVYYLSP